jgi:predicted TIM-barrel fold metal-dependent hydrolase
MKNSEIQYFDCFAAVGRRAGKHPEAPWTTEALVAEMQRCQVNGALVYSHQGKEIHPTVGNPLVDEICQEHHRLHPCWVILPQQTGEFPKPDELMHEMEAHNVRAVKLFPRLHNYAADADTLGALFGALQEFQALVILDRGEYGDEVQVEWGEVSWICESFQRLSLLLHGVRWEATRRLVPLATRFPQLYFEFSNYQGNRMLEFWCEKIGHERLLFGTQALQKSIGAARAYVDYSDISDEQRRAIAGQNLARLLKVKGLPPPQSALENQDKILIQALQGQPIEGSVVIDAHAHILPEGGRGAAMITMNQGDAKAVIDRNQKIGVDKTCVSSWTAVWGDYELGNRDTLQAMKAFPEQVVGYAVLDPNYVTNWEVALKYYYKATGFRGIKPYFPRMQIPYDDPLFEPWWEYGNRHRLFALMHPSDNFGEEMTNLAGRYPNIQFLLAHSGWSWKVACEHVALAKEFPNCHMEITFTSVTSGVIELMVRECGSERVIYGSDVPMRDPFPQFGWVAYADISEEEKRNILGRNMQHILEQVRLS